MIHENIGGKIPSVRSLSKLPIGHVAIDVNSFLQQMRFKEVLAEKRNRELVRMATFCLQQKYPIIMGINLKAHRGEKDKAQQKDATRQIRALETKLTNVSAHIRELQEASQRTHFSELQEAQLVIFRDREKKFKEQRDHIISVSESESLKQEESDLISLFEKSKLPYVRGYDVISQLIVNGQVAYVASEENEYLLHGCILLRNFLWHVRSPAKFALQVYETAKLLDEMKIQADQFLDMGYLLGFGDMECLPGIGKKRIFQGIKQFGTIENFLETKHQKVFQTQKHKDDYLAQLSLAREKTASFRTHNVLSLPPVPPVSVAETLKALEHQKISRTTRLYDIVEYEE